MLKRTACSLRWPLVSCARAKSCLHVARYASSQAIKAHIAVEEKATPPKLSSMWEWSLQDDNLVRKLISEGKTTPQIHAFFPQRTYSACGLRVSALFPKRRRHHWTESEVARLQKMKAEGRTAKEIHSQFPLKSLNTCHAALLKLPRGMSERFTEEERRELWQQRQNGLNVEDIWKRFLPHKSYDECVQEVNRLRIRNPEDVKQLPSISYFTSAEIQSIKAQHSNGARVSEIAQALGRPGTSVYSKIKAMHLEINREEDQLRSKRKPWTDAEDNVLVRIIKGELPRNAAKSLLTSRSDYGIISRLSKLRLRMGYERLKPGYWSEAEEELLQKLHKDKSVTIPEIAQRMGRSRGSVKCKLSSIAHKTRRLSRSVQAA